MEIITIPIDELTPDPANAKDHPTWQIEQIKNSIETFGNLDPIGVWGDQNLIVEGHGRYEALKELGYNEAECIRLDWLTDEERRAYALAHNKLTMNSGWVPGMVESILGEIGSIDMSLFGFDLEPPAGPELPPILEDNPPEEAPTRSFLGQVWQLGDHRLICGDSTDPAVINKLMGGAQADLLVTDPPYNVALGVGDSPEAMKKRKRRTDGLKIKNDAMEADAFEEFLDAAFRNATNHMKPGAPYYVWYASTSQKSFQIALENCNIPPHQILIWNKNTLVLGRQDYQWKHEPCFYGWKEGAGHYFTDSRKETTVIEDVKPDFAKMKKEELRALLEEIYSDKVSTTVIDEAKPARSEEHPTMKPVKLIARLVNNSSVKGGCVLDIFGGSGTTLIASEQLGRKCYTCELDPHYCDVILQRWENLTGREAVLLDDAG